ncbi:uromodulin-like 1 [Sphaeramia orbicularis]|uniref:uromodulin-like 1 n=1 Tax=Sphaeramia orbicularis TaxID=375764 RepID=UPI00117E8239|nr:uromodulin-like 1 [Sphaeramia orbicularis]
MTLLTPGSVLSSSGYHLCTRNETRQVTYLVEYTVPYTVTKPCGWIFWRTCRVTLYKPMQKTENKTMTEQVRRCCDDYVPVGHYCALSVNRSREVTAKPGNCPTEHGFSPGSELCEWDVDCLGWKKCCSSVCTHPTSMNFSIDGRHRFNATVTVKTDYQQMMQKDEGLLNHTRLLHSMVTGALQAAVSVYYLDSWSVQPFTTTTSLLVDCSSTLSLLNVTSELHLLLKHIQEVSSVTVEDINECAHPPLHHCPPYADCTNTVGSFRCTCPPGFTDSDPSDAGVNCTADGVSLNITGAPPRPPINTTNAPVSNSTPDPEDESGSGFGSGSGSGVYTTVTLASESTLTSTTCSPPTISSFRSSNVTGTSFCITWSSWSHGNQTYRVEVLKGSEVIYQNDTGQTLVAVGGLKPGVLYDVTITTMACGGQGDTHHLSIKTDAQTLDATARLTNVQFSADLQNSSSQTYKNLSQSITQEIYQSLSLVLKALVDSGRVRVVVTGFSPGSVVVNFSIVFTPSQSQDIGNVSEAVMDSLKNSSKYSVDENNTSINDFDECASGQNDCSQWATCTNTWASYSCVCNQGYVDNNPDRPGRACQEVATTTMETTTQPMTSTVSTVSFAPSSGSHVNPMLSESTTVASPPSTTTTLSTSMASTIPTTTASTTTTTTIATTSTTTTTATMTSAMTLTTTDETTTATSTTAALTTTDETTTTTSTTAALTTTDETTTATSTTAALTTTDETTTATSTTAALTTTDETTTTTSTTAALTTTDETTTTTLTTAALTTTDETTTATSTTAALTTTDETTTTTLTTAALTTTDETTTLTTAALTTTDETTTTTLTTAALTTTDETTTTTLTAAALTTTTASPTTTTTAPTTKTPALTTTTTAITPPTTTSIASTPTTTAPTTTPGSPTTTTTTTTPVTPDSPTAPTTTISVTSTNPDASTITTTTSATLTTTTTTTTTATMTPTTASTTVTPTTVTASGPSSPTVGTIPNVSALQAISVKCSVAAITVTVEKSFLQISQIMESALYLGLEECGVNWENSSHVQLTVAWNECDVILVHNDSHYTASVTLFSTGTSDTSDPGPVERIRLQVPIMCTYMKSVLISSDFGSMGYDMIEDVIAGSGLFQVSVQLMNGTAPLPQNHSLSRDEAVVLVVSLNTTADHVKVIISKCWATPTPSPSLLYSHTFLENRCSLNTFTKVLTNGNSSVSSVSVQIFSFVDLNMIYLHCQVEICVETGSSSCVPDCFQRTTRSGKTIARAFASSGPLLRLDDEALEEGFNTLHIVGLSCLGVGLTLLFIVGFVCLFYCQRNRIGHYNFNIKPKEENFTYLHFNT